MIDLEESWAMLAACPLYHHAPEESTEKMLIMSDVWAWAFADAIELTDENVERVAELYFRYGFPGLLYYQVEIGDYKKSQFQDNNRFIQFVANEERIRKECPDYNKRAFHKAQYVIDGEARNDGSLV